jgi:hypothetical protein
MAGEVLPLRERCLGSFVATDEGKRCRNTPEEVLRLSEEVKRLKEEVDHCRRGAEALCKWL